MADETDNTQVDPNKAALAQGATVDDLDPATTGGGNPEPDAPPKNKSEAEPEDDKETNPGTDEDPAKEDPDKGDNKDPDPEDDPENKPLDTDVWGTTGNEVGDAVLGLLQNSGLTVEDAKALMFDAVQAGDVTKIDVKALEEKVGKNNATLIMAGTKNFITESKAKAETILNEVHTTVGGKENWDAVTTWANENISEGDLADYRELIDAGGAKARFAASELASRFNGDANNTTLNADALTITPDNKPVQTGKATTRAQYVEAMEEAHARGASEAEINEIKAARNRGRAKGI